MLTCELLLTHFWIFRYCSLSVQHIYSCLNTTRTEKEGVCVCVFVFFRKVPLKLCGWMDGWMDRAGLCEFPELLPGL